MKYQIINALIKFYINLAYFPHTKIIAVKAPDSGISFKDFFSKGSFFFSALLTEVELLLGAESSP